MDAQADVRKYVFSHFSSKVCVIALDKTFSDNNDNNINKTAAKWFGSGGVARTEIFLRTSRTQRITVQWPN